MPIEASPPGPTGNDVDATTAPGGTTGLPEAGPDKASAGIAGLEPDLQVLLSRLAALPEGPFSFQAAMAVTGTRPEQAATLAGLDEAVVGPGEAPATANAAVRRLEAQLAALVETGLLTYEARYHFAPGVHAAASRLTGRDEARRQLVHGFVDWMEKHHRNPQAMLQEQPAWTRALDDALELDDVESFLYFVGWTCAPGGVYHRLRDRDRRLLLLRRAIGLLPGRVDGPSAWIRFVYAALLREIGEIDEAIDQLSQSALLADAMGAEHEAAMARGEWASLLRMKGDHAGAADLYHKKLKALQQLQSPYEFAETCGDLAEVLVEQGDLDNAVALFDQKLGLMQAMGREREAALTRATIGDCLADRGDFNEAIDMYLEALPVLEEMDARNAAVAKANLGVYQLKAGDRAGAIQSVREALAVFRGFHMFEEAQNALELLRELGEPAAE